MNQTSETDFPLDKLPKSVKIRSTCNACQQAKIRCSHDKPFCKRCQKHNIKCIYSVSRRLGRPAKKRDQNADSNGDGPLSKKTRAPKRKKIKEEPTPDFGAKDQSADGDDKPLFNALALDQGRVDDISVDDTSMQTPTLMDIVSAAPFSSSFPDIFCIVSMTDSFHRIVPENLDMSSDSWLHEFMPNPFTDPPPGCAFPLEGDLKLDDATTTPSMNLDSLPLPSDTFSDSTSEGLGPSSSSSFYTAVNSCLPHTGSLPSHRGLPNNSVYPGHSKEELFSWTQNIGSVGANFGESSLFTQLNMPKRGHGYGFAEDELKTDINSLSNICPSQTHDQAIGDLIRVYSYTSQPGSTIAIDSILTCQRVLQQLTETMLQCRGCARIKVNDLMMVMLSIENLIIALDTITAAENDVVERLFPEHFGSLAQEYRADSALTSHARRFKGGSVQLKKQLDACPLIIGGFCVPSEEKCVFVKRMLQRRLAGLQRTVQRIQVYAQEFLASSTSTGKMLTMKDIYEKLQLVTVRLKMLTRP
ncbi:Zn(II)2Cys6 transcription factor domain-containing protein [Aspergillus stella-maris]|uniref:Zn(II)2Cys6 transcription factor domain-containing protein n=1 Tax=Aspergillus stella-maris TaxID=1810926 RepID=UPI003CCCD02B